MFWGSMSVDALIVMLGKVTWLMHAFRKVTIGECYLVKLMIKNIHKKMYFYNEIELCAPNKDIICRFND
jgi:hypothetical protein